MVAAPKISAISASSVSSASSAVLAAHLCGHVKAHEVRIPGNGLTSHAAKFER